MSLDQKINQELKQAILSGDKLRMETLRSVRASIIEFAKSGIGREMNPDDELKLLQNAAKRRRDAIELYERGNRQDLADKEKAELVILSEFLPQQISEGEAKDIVQRIASEVGASDMKDLGKVMGPVMKELKGKYDGAKVQALVREILGGNA